MKSKLIYLLFLSILHLSCKKDWLDAKPNQSLIVPNTIQNLQALLEDTYTFNDNYSNTTTAGADEYYIIQDNFTSLSQFDRNIYTWASTNDFYNGADLGFLFDWNQQYKAIFTINTVLENIEQITPGNQQSQWENVKGSALFFRAFGYYNLGQLYCKPYQKESASSEPGMILRLKPDINEKVQRSTIQQTYDQIIKDLSDATDLLPTTVSIKTKPSKIACFAMLARVYLTMSDYEKCKAYSDSTLKYQNTLIDYNTVSGLKPFVLFSNEVIFHSRMVATQLQPTLSSTGRRDSVLFNMYGPNDLRKKVFFLFNGGKYIFMGNYGNDYTKQFNGLATDEAYLMRAECCARAGNNELALEDLNNLLQKRWDKNVPYIPYTSTNSVEILDKILQERRKELCYRGLRWTDLRRLNQEDRYKTTLKRMLDKEYTLPPNDNRYTYPIPGTEVTHSGVQQNPR